jgi:hypothetical protein
MRASKIVLLIGWTALVMGVTYFFCHKTPPYQGAFRWEKMVVEKQKNDIPYDWVVHDLEKKERSFQLSEGDECYVLTNGEWSLADQKEWVSGYYPILCPHKGAGWFFGVLSKEAQAWWWE